MGVLLVCAELSPLVSLSFIKSTEERKATPCIIYRDTLFLCVVFKVCSAQEFVRISKMRCYCILLYAIVVSLQTCTQIDFFFFVNENLIEIH